MTYGTLLIGDGAPGQEGAALFPALRFKKTRRATHKCLDIALGV